jgi:hypothetical protein
MGTAGSGGVELPSKSRSYRRGRKRRRSYAEGSRGKPDGYQLANAALCTGRQRPSWSPGVHRRIEARIPLRILDTGCRRRRTPSARVACGAEAPLVRIESCPEAVLRRSTDLGRVSTQSRSILEAIVLGPPYRKLWTDFDKAAVEQDGLAFVSIEDWTSAASAFDRTGAPPQAARIVHTGALTDVVPREYPTEWPFGPPRVA